MDATGNPPDLRTSQATRPVLRVHLEGERAELGRIAASDVAELLLAVERAIARAASVAVGRPSRKPGARELVINQAAHLVLRGIEAGSVTPVLELPTVNEAVTNQAAMDIRVAHLGEIAVEQILDVLSARIDGHPYVVEALDQLARTMQIGIQYEAVRMELHDSHVSPRIGTIDLEMRKRLAARVKIDQAATREGMLVGTLVEADFESFTARLRSADGSAVTVSFDPSLADDIHRALREPAQVEGWVTYDPANQQARSISLRTVRRADQLVLGIDSTAFRHHKTFKELQAEQGVTGIFDISGLHDAESTDAELDAYDQALQQLREA